jgi:hypothetical protein
MSAPADFDFFWTPGMLWTEAQKAVLQSYAGDSIISW